MRYALFLSAYICGVRLDTIITASIGEIQCTITRTGKEGVFDVDLWQGAPFMDGLNTYTTFRAAVSFRLEGEQYKIIRRKASQYNNALWLELETIISNVIVINT